ncbi:MAG TPA: HD domain-containing protein [Solirubrobacteraceae bacterium]|jgi:(p)ppGpp synthase/HD superfamily hydrolase|nr:HD domain-containing protein [Solirubrobacteraceae bacterium]
MGVAQGIPSSVGGLPKSEAALEYATRAHAAQLRDVDGAPFIVHPSEVALLLRAAGAPDHLIAAGALHDVIEKTPATAFDLRRRFGSRTAALVLAVSEDKRIRSYSERKRALRERVAQAGEEALMLFAADKISKARELHIRPARRSPRAIRLRLRRRAHYEHCLALLRERLPDSPLVGELEYELARKSRRQ